MNYEDIQSKIKSYYTFIEEKLKPDLKEVELLVKKKRKELEEWIEVIAIAKLALEFKEKNKDMDILFELSKYVHSSGHITDYNYVCVNIGLNCLLEMEPEEAIKYANIRKKLINREMLHAQSLAINIKVHIKYVLLAINELQNNIK